MIKNHRSRQISLKPPVILRKDIVKNMIERQPTLHDRLQELYIDWSNEQPAEIISSEHSNPLNKYRKGWFTSVIGNLQIGVRKNLWNEDITKQVDELTDIYCTPEFQLKAKVTQADIQRIDRILAVVTGLNGQQ